MKEDMLTIKKIEMMKDIGENIYSKLKSYLTSKQELLPNEMVIRETDLDFLADSLKELLLKNDWRKVSEELPYIGFRVLTRNLFDVVHLGYIDVAGDWRYCLNHELIKDDIIVWKPIN